MTALEASKPSGFVVFYVGRDADSAEAVAATDDPHVLSYVARYLLSRPREDRESAAQTPFPPLEPQGPKTLLDRAFRALMRFLTGGEYHQ